MARHEEVAAVRRAAKKGQGTEAVEKGAGVRAGARIRTTPALHARRAVHRGVTADVRRPVAAALAGAASRDAPFLIQRTARGCGNVCL